MKIALIQPKPNLLHFFSGLKAPSVGLAIIATELDALGHTVKIFAEEFLPLDYDFILSSDLVGISVMTPTVNRGIEIAQKIRREKPNLRIVFGGPHATFCPEEMLAYGDFVVRGEGDRVLIELINNDFNPRGIKNLCTAENVDIPFKPEEPFCDLNQLKPIKYELIQGYDPRQRLYLSTSRGCPFNCNFCSVTGVYGRKYRYVNPEYVIAAIEKYRPRWVCFVDDNFTENRSRAKILLKEIIARKLKFRWVAEVRTEVAQDEELLELISKSGCNSLHFGFEAVTDNTLSYYNKNQTVQDIERCIQLVHKRNINIHGMFVLGADMDSPESIRLTLDFAIKNQLGNATFWILTPGPGVKIYEEYKRTGRLVDFNWDHYNGHYVVFTPRNMSAAELQENVKKISLEFTAWPEIIKLVMQGKLKTAAYRYVNRRIFQKLFA